jgi:cardiolipin synthase
VSKNLQTGEPGDWVAGNRFHLLENGEDYFPAVFAAIESARREVLLETFILFEDKVGLALRAVLIDAAQRGVRVEATIDGFGSNALSARFVEGLAEAGVKLHVFDPPPRLGRRLGLLRRLHRKIVVVDGEVAFVGGINFSADHLADFGPEAKQDYAVEARGPIVADIRHEALRILAPVRGGLRWLRRWRGAEGRDAAKPPAAGDALARFVTRDNRDHLDDIERHYRRALNGAKREVIIANAYFFPGYRLLKSIRRAAKRGVKVQLVLQGQPDLPWVSFASKMLYHHLINAGVRIVEYCERPMHGKVALVDDDWATIGSSNLEPLSLALNLEANLMIRDPAFNAALRGKLESLIRDRCREVQAERIGAWRWWWRMGLSYVVFHVLARYPRWAARLPEHRPVLQPAGETAVVVPKPVLPPAEPWHWRGGAKLSPFDTGR